MAHSMAEPRLIERHCGGWLAVSPMGSTVKIGVPADTRDDAVAAYRSAMAEWQTILGERATQQRNEPEDA